LPVQFHDFPNYVRVPPNLRRQHPWLRTSTG
jgi:hypothetical protein